MTQYIEHDLGGPEVHALSAAREDRAGDDGAPATMPSAKAALKKIGQVVADPIIHAIKGQEPATLAKIAAAVVAPRLLKSAMKIAVRHPLLSIAGLAGFSAWAMRRQPTA